MFGAGNYEGALADYLYAYRLLQGHPRQYIVLHNLALCHERLYRYDAALDYYDRYLREGGPSAEDRRSVAAVIQSLRSLLAELEIETDSGAQIWVDNRHARDGPGLIHLAPGRHSVEVRGTLREPKRREFQLQPRSRVKWHAVLEPLSNYRGPSPAYAWAGVALTGTALATGVVFGIQTLHARDEGLAKARTSLSLRTPETEAAESNIARFALATDISFAVALLFGAATTVLVLVSDWERGETRPTEPKLSASFDPVNREVSVCGRLPW
jgi:tetratricopeptide (TPR) repeat protein